MLIERNKTITKRANDYGFVAYIVGGLILLGLTAFIIVWVLA